MNELHRLPTPGRANQRPGQGLLGGRKSRNTFYVDKELDGAGGVHHFLGPRPYSCSKPRSLRRLVIGWHGEDADVDLTLPPSAEVHGRSAGR